MLGIARDVGRHVPVALEAAGHPVLDLLLERAVDGGPADGGVARADAVIQLPRGERASGGRQGLGDDHALCRPPPAAGGEPGVDRSGAHKHEHRPVRGI